MSMMIIITSSSKHPVLFCVLMLLCIHNCYADVSISTVCNPIIGDAFCNQTLTSPECLKVKCTSSNYTLCSFLISKAKTAAQDAKTLVQLLRSNKTVVKSVADACHDNYDDAIDEMKECFTSVKELKTSKPLTTDAFNLLTYASAFITDISTCEQGFEDIKAPVPTVLKEANQVAYNLADMLLIVVGLWNVEPFKKA